MNVSWQSAFVAVAALVGEPLDAVTAALSRHNGNGDDGKDDGAARAADLVQTLRSAPRDFRARAMARVLSEVALALDPPGSS